MGYQVHVIGPDTLLPMANTDVRAELVEKTVLGLATDNVLYVQPWANACVLAHELAHRLLNHTRLSRQANSFTHEWQAERVARTVCGYFDVKDDDQFNRSYSGLLNEPAAVDALPLIELTRRVAGQIIDAVEDLDDCIDYPPGDQTLLRYS
jgi:hypothetical protein